MVGRRAVLVGSVVVSALALSLLLALRASLRGLPVAFSSTLLSTNAKDQPSHIVAIPPR
jgi:hypothetical protein